jgi:thiamine biosynthesis protein ThiS
VEIEISLNGEQRNVSQGTTVSGLVEILGLLPERVAIEYNLQILKREKWVETCISQGDRIEIVHFVGGG